MSIEEQRDLDGMTPEEIVAAFRSLQRALDWVRATVMTNADVCAPCRAEIARACGWVDA